MMRTIICVILGLLFSVRAAITVAQERPSSVAGWMLEVSRANHPSEYFEVSDDGFDSQLGIDELDREAGQDGSDKSQPQPSSLELTCRLSGDSVQLRVTLAFKSQDSDSAQWPEVLVGTWVVRPSEPATLSELTRFGLKPLEVRLVGAKSLASRMPSVINKTNSLAVEEVDDNRSFYRISLRNNMQVGVAGVVVLVVGSNDICDLHTFRGTHGALIGPSETHRLEMDVPKTEPEWFGPDGESCSSESASDIPNVDRRDSTKIPGSSSIVIDAVDFEDGTYEGDAAKAAMLECIRLGQVIEQERITALVEEELRNAQSDDSRTISSIRTKVLLPDEPGPALVRSTMDRFSFLPAKASTSIERDLRAGLWDQKALLLNNLKTYALEVSSGLVPGVSLQQWWNATKGRCDLLVPQSCEKRR